MDYKLEVADRGLQVSLTYKIIQDLPELERFVAQLPDLGEGFKYYISLFARKKYGGTEGLKSDKAQLKRCVASKDMIIKKIKQMEIPFGYYDIDGLVINQESLVLYISANPRDMHEAGVATALKLTRTVFGGQKIKNPQADALSQIQVNGAKVYFNVDVDTEAFYNIGEFEIRYWLSNKMNQNAYKLVQTRGGFHVLVELSKLEAKYKKSWYNAIKDTAGLPMTIDLSNGDGMLPVPGCVQAKFIPRML